jgi:hypothetical protein
MGRPRKKAQDLTTAEALRKLFPPEARAAARKEAKEAEKKATRKDSK